MPGSGKTTFSNFFRISGNEVVRMGDVIRKLAKKRGLDYSRETIGNLAVNIRSEESETIVAEECIKQINGKLEDLIIVEGIRSFSEVKRFNQDYDTELVAVHASQKTRFKRLLKRGRRDDPKKLVEFYMRDVRELNFGIGKVIALADYIVINEYSPDKFREQYKKMVARLNL
jgi:dephospho-CoA kinase